MHPEERKRGQEDERGKQTKQHHSFNGACALTRGEEGEQENRAEFTACGTSDDELSKIRRVFPSILQDGHHNPKGGREEQKREKEREHLPSPMSFFLASRRESFLGKEG